MTRSADILVVGGGTSGAALAGLLAKDQNRKVLLLEAGPDYGSLTDGSWPPELLDASTIPQSHSWGYSGMNHPSQSEPHPYNRARVIGGCSSHNGCVALLGHRRDYDGWAELGNDGWSWDAVAPAFERSKEALRLRIPRDQELTPIQAAFVDGAVEAGIPRVEDLNDPDDVEGVAPSPANVFNGVRWNSSLAYIDPIRGQGNLTVVGNALVDRVIFDGNQRRRRRGVHRRAGGALRSRTRSSCRRELMALRRSCCGPGIGPADDLSALDIDVIHDLVGVGGNLADHPVLHVNLEPSAKLLSQMEIFGTVNWLPDEQALLKARSSLGDEAFDLHLYSVSGENPVLGGRQSAIEVSCIMPYSSGQMKLASKDPSAAPIIDHGYLSDPEGHDLAVLMDGLELARQITGSMRQRGLIDRELSPGDGLSSDDDLRRWAKETVGIYYHPSCSCKMGPSSDAQAVVDPRGKVHGLEGLSVCDASIFPVIMRANTNLPAVMLAEHMAGWIGR